MIKALTQFYFLAVVLALVSCSGNQPENTSQQDTTATKDSVATAVTDSSYYKPFQYIERVPKKVYEFDSIRIESYDFVQFEPFLHQQDNYTYVVNFWATWCVPCVAELPYFEQLRENYLNHNVHVMLVSIDFSKAVETSLVPFLRDKKLKSEVVLLDDPDANSWIEKVDPDWSGAIPATVIYNKDKRSFTEGSFTYEELEAKLQEILKD